MIVTFRMMILSSMYPGNLKEFYKTHPGILPSDYDEHYNTLLADSTEFAASYTKAFCKNGITAECIIANDRNLQVKWAAGNNVKTGTTKDYILKRISAFQPDILWIEDMRYTSLDFLKLIRNNENNLKLIVGYHCAPINSIYIDRFKLFDLVVTCTPGLKLDFEEAGIKSYLVYHGFDSGLLPAIESFDTYPMSNVIFSGSLYQGDGYHNNRIQLIDYLVSKGIDMSLYVNIESNVRLFSKKILFKINNILLKIGIRNPENVISYLQHGKQEVIFYPDRLRRKINAPRYGLEMYRLFRSSRIVLNSHGDVAGKYAGNMRLFEATGAGSCLLTDNKDNLPDLFDVGNEILVYNDPEECAQKIKWLLENDTERKRIAAAGQKRTLNSHTVDGRSKSIIEILRNELLLKG